MNRALTPPLELREASYQSMMHLPMHPIDRDIVRYAKRVLAGYTTKGELFAICCSMIDGTEHVLLYEDGLWSIP